MTSHRCIQKLWKGGECDGFKSSSIIGSLLCVLKN